VPAIQTRRNTAPTSLSSIPGAEDRRRHVWPSRPPHGRGARRTGCSCRPAIATQRAGPIDHGGRSWCQLGTRRHPATGTRYPNLLIKGLRSPTERKAFDQDEDRRAARQPGSLLILNVSNRRWRRLLPSSDSRRDHCRVAHQFIARRRHLSGSVVPLRHREDAVEWPRPPLQFGPVRRVCPRGWRYT
jgi:hypothetical protein